MIWEKSVVGKLALFSAFIYLIACSPLPHHTRHTHRGHLSAPCPKKVSMVVGYCPTKYAYSDRIQHLSKVRIKSLETGKSLTLPVRKSSRVKGLCIPRKYKRFMSKGNRFLAQVRVLRCGENGVGRCPKYIRGYASWYGPKFHGRRTASGRRFNMYEPVAAHRTLPFGTLLLVKNLKNGRSVRVKVIDRGPFVRGRHLDLSYSAAKKLGMLADGVVPFVAKVIRCGE